MRLKEILVRKGHHVESIEEDRFVLDAVKTLVHHGIGSLLVTRNGSPTGIVTERDILRLTARTSRLDDHTVQAVMTSELVVASPDDELYAMMDVMTEKRIRHLPVVEGGRVVGIVSIGDLLKASRMLAEDENSQLRQYIHGRG